MAEAKDVAALVAEFGAAAKAKLHNIAASGSPEDQLRGPLEALVGGIGEAISGKALRPVLVGETQISELKTRPDYAVTRMKALLVGHIEVKAPGKGGDPRAFTDPHDKAQWEKLKALPNLIYTDGNAFMLWRDGKKEGEAFLVGDIRSSGSALKATDDLERLFLDFLSWQPISPKKPAKLAEMSARLCRLLRDEVREQLAAGSEGLTRLRADLQKLMFPDWTEVEFADGYAQSVTFGLLMARARGISLKDGLHKAAQALRSTNSLIGAALDVLTEGAEQERLSTSLRTMMRVFEEVDWPTISKGDPEAWLYFYEIFLQAYDKDLRKKTGSYYTPPQVVAAMVRLTDEALRSRFGEAMGLASHNVKVADPAVGTGTFLLSVLRVIADTVTARDGEGAVPGEIEAALQRLIGFELQFGPFAVAQLRMLADVAELTNTPSGNVKDAALRLHVADTLADPDEDTAWIPKGLTEIGASRKAANKMKRNEPITVVIGNPPYKVRAKELGGWVADRGSLAAPIDDWMPPRDWNLGAHAKHLHNLYVYFWRWAAWKVFGGDPFRSGTDKTPSQHSNERGVICFITAAGFLNGPGFQQMRAALRREADEIWVIDCSPEGHQSAVNTRIFQGVQHPVCIVLVARYGASDPSTPARVLFRELPEGHREEKKFKALAELRLDGEGWQPAATGWRAPFLPAGRERWESYPPLAALFDYDGSGVLAGRTWPIAPDSESLGARWDNFKSAESDDAKALLFKEDRDRLISKTQSDGVAGHEYRSLPLAKDTGAVVSPCRYGFRSFNRMWIIPDKRLIRNERPVLWGGYSGQQLFLTASHDRTPENGPSVSFTSLVPDLHHYHGRGGRVFPLWANAAATVPNVRPALLDRLTESYGVDVTAPDVMVYLAAVAAHPGYTARFAADLRQPGLRIPITVDAALFKEAVVLGCEIVWLHTFGERFADPAAGRPASAPRASPGPVYPKDGAIPTDPDRWPDEMSYDAAMRRLHVGEGFFDNVDPKVWAYEVSGMRVLTQWFSYRKKDRSRPLIGDKTPPSPLDKITAGHWLQEYSTELVNVLHVLTRLVALEPAQDDLLARIVASPQLDSSALKDVLRPVE